MRAEGMHDSAFALGVILLSHDVGEVAGRIYDVFRFDDHRLIADLVEELNTNDFTISILNEVVEARVV